MRICIMSLMKMRTLVSNTTERKKKHEPWNSFIWIRSFERYISVNNERKLNEEIALDEEKLLSSIIGCVLSMWMGGVRCKGMMKQPMEIIFCLDSVSNSANIKINEFMRRILQTWIRLVANCDIMESDAMYSHR